jgi:prevent-host-death family protein
MPQQTIGVRELKNKATQVVRAVREHAAEYIVTVDGEPVAVLRPFTEDDDRQRRQETMRQEMQALRDLSRVVSESWISPKSALEILDEVRDESW